MYNLHANQVSKKIIDQEITSEEYISIIIDRINSIDSKINAFISKNFDFALSKAKELDRKIKNHEKIGILAGIPLGIKDNISVKGLKNTCASRMLQDYIAPFNATVIDRLENQDAIIIGKLNMDEFGMGTSNEFSSYGPVCNPWDLDYVSGGSSGGSAAAVASMQIPIALGSDTGGSIRCPSSFCSVIGFKPTYGTVSRNGLVSYSNSLEQIGPLARSIYDLVPLLNIISGRDDRDDTTMNIPSNYELNTFDTILKKKYKIGFLDELISNSDSEVSKIIYDKSEMIKDIGMTVNSASLNYTDYALASYYIIATAEASSNLSRFDNIRYGYKSNPEGYEWNSYYTKMRDNFGDEVKRRILIGTYVLSAGYYGKYYLKAQKIRSIIKNELKKLFRNHDLIMIPTMPILPFKIGEKISNPIDLYNLDIYTILANLSGIPAISIPAGFSNNGLPIGIQFLADSFNEQKLIDMAVLFETNNKLTGGVLKV